MEWLAVGASSLALSAGNSAPLGASRQHAVINGVASPGINFSFDAVDAPPPSVVVAVPEGYCRQRGQCLNGDDDWAAAPPLAEPAYGVQPRSVVVLLVRVGAGDTP